MWPRFALGAPDSGDGVQLIRASVRLNAQKPNAALVGFKADLHSRGDVCTTLVRFEVTKLLHSEAVGVPPCFHTAKPTVLDPAPSSAEVL